MPSLSQAPPLNLSCLCAGSSQPACGSSSSLFIPFCTTYTSTPPSGPLNNSLVKFLVFFQTWHTFFSPELVIASLFKIKSEDLEYKYLISYILWTKAETKAELWPIVKLFSKVTKFPHSFAEEEFNSHSNILLCFSAIYQLVHMLVSEVLGQHWINNTNWENLEKWLESQREVQPAC